MTIRMIGSTNEYVITKVEKLMIELKMHASIGEGLRANANN